MDENTQCKMEGMIPFERKSFRQVINQSWDRCAGYGLTNEDRPRVPQVLLDQMEKIFEKHEQTLKIAHSYMKSLSAMTIKKGGILGLSNSEGVILHIEGDSPALRKLGYERGYIHLEKYMGTNAIGTCLHTGKPIIVWEEDHFLQALREWVGFAAPIYTGENHLDSVLFAMVPVEKASRASMAIISVGANSIERQLQLLKDKENLLNIQEMMQQTQASIIEASSIISHEVKNSLTNISAYIQLLQLDKSINHFRGERILREISRVNRLLDDFKLLSRHHHESIMTQSLNESLQSVLDIMKPKAELGNVEIIYRPYKENVSIKADRSGLHHVFVNLIDNAIQAMENGGILTIECDIEPETNEVAIKFKDTGPGIPADQIDQIFKIFHTTKKNGSGLGLHICQTIIKFYGGKIEVDSVPGQGATFIVKLPMVK